jgi:hypothetical protein
MDWIQTLSIMGTVIATAYYIHREVQADIRAANLRSDRLYEIYVELRKDFDKRFYDMLKERK